jgi:DNA-binding SARP family transcriptional activator
VSPDRDHEPAPVNRDRRRFLLLGPFEFRHGGREVKLAGKGLTIFAGLLLRPNQPVSPAELTRIVWDDAGSHRRPALHALISRLRHGLGAAAAINTVDDGYQLDLAAGELDLQDFQAEVAKADRAALAGDRARERMALSNALAVWRGPALTGVSSRTLQQEFAVPLDEQRLWALSRRIDLDIRDNHCAAVIGDLKRLTARYPLREGFASQLMTALYRCGRRAETLDVYRDLRAALLEKAGMEPCAAVTELHQAILSGTLPANPFACRLGTSVACRKSCRPGRPG